MLNYITSFYNYLKLFVSIGVFTFIFKKCLDTCIEKVTIKSKNGKNKQTIKARIGVALTYLIFCSILYFSLTPKVLLTILSIIGIGTLYALDRFDKPTVEKLNSYDKNKSLRFVWKLLYTIINIVLIIYTPIHNKFSSIFSGLFGIRKNKTNNLMGGLGGLGGLGGFGGLGELAGLGELGDLVGTKGVNLGQNIKKTIHELTSDNKNEEPSSMGDYVNKTDNGKTIGENQKVIIEETSTDINNEMSTEVKQVNVVVKLNSTEIEDFEKFNKILNSEMSKTIQNDEDEQDDQENNLSEESNGEANKTIDSEQESSTQEDITIENNNIDKKAESERLLKLFKKMNDIFSTEEQSNTDT